MFVGKRFRLFVILAMSLCSEMIVVSAQSVEHGGKTFAELIDGGKIKSDVDSAFQSGGKESYAKFRFNLALEQYELAQKIMKAPDFDFDDKQGREPVLSLLLGARDSATGKRNGMGAFNHFINIITNLLNRHPQQMIVAVIRLR